MAKRFENEDILMCLMIANAEGDEAAIKRFDISARTLNDYRDLLNDSASELAKTFRKFRAVLAEWGSEPLTPFEGLVRELDISSDRLHELADSVKKGEVPSDPVIDNLLQEAEIFEGTLDLLIRLMYNEAVSEMLTRGSSSIPAEA